MRNSFTYSDAADTKSHDTITVCREALRLSRQNGCFCRNFSLGSITSYRAAEERSSAFVLWQSCSPERARRRLYGQAGGFNKHALHKDKGKRHKVRQGAVHVIIFSGSAIYRTSPYVLPGDLPSK